MRVHRFQHIDNSRFHEGLHVRVFDVQLIHVIKERIEFLSLGLKLGVLYLTVLTPGRNRHEGE